MRLNKFDQFLHDRECLIEHYKKGDLTKEEFNAKWAVILIGGQGIGIKNRDL